MSQTSPTPVDALPSAPATTSPANFAALADAFVAALATFRTQLNALATNVYANALDAYANALASAASASASAVSATNSAASATAASSAGNAAAWVSGTSYLLGQCVYSPITFQTYRRKLAGAGTSDPSIDASNWAPVGGSSPGSTLFLSTHYGIF